MSMLSRSTLSELNKKFEAESGAVGAEPPTGDASQRPKNAAGPAGPVTGDAMEKPASPNQQRLHDILNNPIIHTLPNLGPIPRS
jgi:hypothetical protein